MMCDEAGDASRRQNIQGLLDHVIESDFFFN